MGKMLKGNIVNMTFFSMTEIFLNQIKCQHEFLKRVNSVKSVLVEMRFVAILTHPK